MTSVTSIASRLTEAPLTLHLHGRISKSETHFSLPNNGLRAKTPHDDFILIIITVSEFLYIIHQFKSYCISHNNDSSHQSAGALDRLIKKDFAEKRLVFVVAMASDKDHVAFAKELLTGLKPDLVVRSCSVG